MNEWQLYRQIQYILRARTWEETGELVFPSDSVIVTAAPERDLLPSMRMPAAWLRAREIDADPEHGQAPGFQRGNLVVTIVVQHAGDRTGQAAMIGGNRAGQDQSGGRGLLEVAEEVLDELRQLGKSHGVKIRFVGAGAGVPELVNKRYTLRRDYYFEASFTDTRRYPPARKLAAVVSGSGAGADVNLTWTLPADRFDRDKVVLVRKAGATAPSTRVDGTELVLSGDLVAAHTDNPGVGTWSYALWVRYDEYSDGSNYRFSDAVSVAAVAVS